MSHFKKTRGDLWQGKPFSPFVAFRHPKHQLQTMSSQIQSPTETKILGGFFSCVVALAYRITWYLLLMEKANIPQKQLRYAQADPNTTVLRKKELHSSSFWLTPSLVSSINTISSTNIHYLNSSCIMLANSSITRINN